MPGLWSSFMGISYRIYIMVFAIVTDRILELISNTTRIWPKFGYIGKLNQAFSPFNKYDKKKSQLMKKAWFKLTFKTSFKFLNLSFEYVPDPSLQFTVQLQYKYIPHYYKRLLGFITKSTQRNDFPKKYILHTSNILASNIIASKS